MSAARVRIHIGALSVTGLGTLSRAQLHDAIVAELSQRFTVAPLASPAAGQATLDAGAFPLRAGMGTAAIGRAIADRVHGSVAP